VLLQMNIAVGPHGRIILKARKPNEVHDSKRRGRSRDLLRIRRPAEAKTKIVVTYPYIAALVGKLPRTSRCDQPSQRVMKIHISWCLALRHRQAAPGGPPLHQRARWRSGFVPPLIRQANNPKIMPGAQGFVDLSQFVELIDKPDSVSRARAIIHPEGNPHFITDWQQRPGVGAGHRR